MIQRIQSIYLLVAVVICAFAPFIIPEMPTGDTDLAINYNHSLVFGGFHFTGLVALISIVLFKNRKLQMGVIRFAIVISIILLGLFVYWSLMLPGENGFSEKGIGILFPVISIVFLVLAYRAINKDDNLVKSADRLR